MWEGNSGFGFNLHIFYLRWGWTFVFDIFNWVFISFLVCSSRQMFKRKKGAGWFRQFTNILFHFTVLSLRTANMRNTYFYRWDGGGQWSLCRWHSFVRLDSSDEGACDFSNASQLRSFTAEGVDVGGGFFCISMSSEPRACTLDAKQLQSVGGLCSRSLGWAILGGGLPSPPHCPLLSLCGRLALLSGLASAWVLLTS